MDTQSGSIGALRNGEELDNSMVVPGDGMTAIPLSSPPNVGRTEHLFKILFLGDFAVGKTSLIMRYVEGTFTPNYKLTIGVDFALKLLHWDEKNLVNLQIWDVAGQERFNIMTRAYYRYAIAAVLVYDVTRPGTLDAVLKWKEDLDSKVMLANGEPIPCILLANKCDIEPPNSMMMDSFCERNGLSKWFPTSAKEDIGIDQAFNYLVKQVLAISASNRIEAGGQESKGAVDVGLGGEEKPRGGSSNQSCCT